MYMTHMCGRFALGIPKKSLEKVFAAQLQEPYVPHFNIAPGREILVVSSSNGEPEFLHRQWGLVPHWAKDASVGYKMTNARSETVFEKPAFRDSVRTARCLIPAQAFYEWKEANGVKQPYAISLVDEEVFAMAGVMAHWEDVRTGEVVDSCSILTCPPNTLMDSIHHRMPVILPPESWGAWLDVSMDQPELLSEMLIPFQASPMRAWPVSAAVNKTVHDGPDLLKQIQVMQQGSLF